MTHVFPPPMERSYAIRDGKIDTRSLEAHVVDHCNLTCAECCSYSPRLPRWFADPAELERDLVQAARVVRPRVFKLVGGEPLLHPALADCAEVARRSGVAPRISVTTNGLLLARAPDALFAAIDAITISLYPAPALPAEHIAEIEARAARFSVALNWKRQDEFVQMDRPHPAGEEESRAVFADCWLRERCHVVRDGTFYTCTRPSHVRALTGEDVTSDGVLLDELDVGTLLTYLQREAPLAACAACFGGSGVSSPHRLLGRDELVALRRA
jgi:GTP 3',8-cyclase